MTCTRDYVRRLFVLLLAVLASGAVPMLCGCSSTTAVVDDEYDRKIRRSYLQPRQLAFFESRFASDREEMTKYIKAFSSEELSGVMKDEMVQLCRDSSPILGANLAYMIARAGIDRVIPFIKEQLGTDDRYVRWRALMSIAPGWAEQFKARLLPLTGDSEPDADVRKLAREKYRAIVSAADYQMLWDALGSERANDESFRDFVGSCLLESLGKMDDLQRDGRTDAMARGIGEGGPWQDAFALELLQGKMPPEALPSLIRAYVDRERAANMRRLVVLEVWRHIDDGVAPPADLAGELRTRAADDLVAGSFDPDKLGDLLRAVELDDETTDKLATWLADAKLDKPEDASPSAIVAIRLLADLAPPTVQLTERLIEATGNPQLEFMAVSKLAAWLADSPTDDLPRDEMIDALGQALESDDEPTREAAAMGLARVDNELAMEILVDTLKSDVEGAVKAASNALIQHGDREALAGLEIDLCDIVRLDGPRPMATYNIIAGLRLLELVGADYTLDFMSQYCRAEDATVEVSGQIERTRKAIEDRLDGN